MDISEKLKQLRKARGLTQSQVAEFIGQERSTIACYETGKRTPDIHTLENLAKLYKVTLDHFSTKSEADVMIDLLSRSNAFFSSVGIADEDKDAVYRDIMKLYLQSKEENHNTNARQDIKANANGEAKES